MVHVVGWPLKFLDRWLARKPNAHRLAFGVYCTAYSGSCSFRFNRAGLSDVKLGVIPPVSTVTEVTARRCSPWGFCRRSTTTKATA